MARFANRILALTGAAFMAVAPAHAATIIRSYTFTGTNIVDIIGSAPSPLSSVNLSFTVEFDPLVQVFNQTAGLTLNSTNLALGTPFAFSFIPTNNNRLAVGGTANGVLGTNTANDDFTLDFSQATGPNPVPSVFVFTTSGTPGSAFRAFATSLTASVPEPATWAMLILGFGGIGAVMRRRSRTLATI